MTRPAPQRISDPCLPVNLLQDYSSHDFLTDRGESLGEQDDRSLVSLLTEQIEFADVVILNKISDAGPERTDSARKIIRAKGHFWIATRPRWAAEFSLAGAISSVKPLGLCWASVPEEHLPTHPEAQAEIARNWVEPWGDRRQELVFIGVGLDQDAIQAKLNAALLDVDEFRPQDWTDLPDPFPRWRER